MDFNDILDTIFTYDETKPWGILIPQVILYCFRNYCVKRIMDSYEINENISETLGINWTSLYELCSQNCDASFKTYLPDFFEPASYEQFEDGDGDLLEIFFKNFIKSLDTILETNATKEYEEKEELFINFLDNDIFVFFFKNINDKKFYIFPKDTESELNVELFLQLRQTVLTNSLVIEYESIHETTPLYIPVPMKTNSAMKALLYKRKMKGKTYRNISSRTDTTRKHTNK